MTGTIVPSPPYLGEEGTEQFTVQTIVDGKTIRVQPIHDPFIHSYTVLKQSRWTHFLGMFKPQEVKVEVHVGSTEGAQRAIMTLDPYRLQHDTEEILRDRKASREANDAAGIMGYFNS